MGWANCGTDTKDRPIGYAHEATCDHQPGCSAQIDRGLSYACGEMHGKGEFSCEGYFCGDHRRVVNYKGNSYSLCFACADRFDKWRQEPRLQSERRPNKDSGFREVEKPRVRQQVIRISGWVRGNLQVISSLQIMDMPDGSGERGPQWHVSVSRQGLRRASNADMERVRKAFKMQQAEEDNHQPGVTRNLMLVCDPARRVTCECKETEEVIREPDGFEWSNPTDPAKCRGCEHERLMGKPCPLHGQTEKK